MKRTIDTKSTVWNAWMLVLTAMSICLPPCQGRIVEKIETVCNGPCGRLTALCPKGHRVAIRDAVYRVQEKTANCTLFPGCSDPRQDVCCEPTPNDCVFPYSPTHLKALLRNCSGNADCLIQTERSDVETVACSTTDPENLSSQTALNYVCVKDDVIVNICSRTESIVQGKTLFAMLNPMGTRKPPKGSVCTCLAESTKWPTTNSIAVFLVDMRLNAIMSRDCAGASLSVRSGSNIKQLDCESSRDPRVNFPFVAVLNDSNVATLKLEITQNLPEFLWFGFEANEEEDIRLSCKLQGFLSNQPPPPETLDGNSQGQDGTQSAEGVDGIEKAKGPSNRNKKDSQPGRPRDKMSRSKGKKVNVAALVGGMVAGFLLILLVILLLGFLVIRWKKKQQTVASCDLADPDMEVYYSTTDDEIRNLAATKADNSTKQDLYDSPEKVEVKIRKKNSSKKVRIVSTPEFLDNTGEDYVTALEIRERKRLTERRDLDGGSSNNYDHLERGEGRHDDLVLDGYDQLHQNEDKPPSYSSISGMEVEDPGRGHFHPMDSGYNADLGRVNQAYEDTSASGAEDGEGQPGLYFELERGVSDGDSLSYEDHYYASRGSKTNEVTDKTSDLAASAKFPVTSATMSLTYTDAVSVKGLPSFADSERRSPRSLMEEDERRRQSMPIAAPRRNISKQTRTSHYDFAKPIP